MLYSRWWGWTQPSEGFPNGRFGDAGEQVNHRTLQSAASAIGLTMINENGADVQSILGVTVQGGALDHAGWITTQTSQGRPVGHILALIEVKTSVNTSIRRTTESFRFFTKRRWPPKITATISGRVRPGLPTPALSHLDYGQGPWSLRTRNDPVLHRHHRRSCQPIATGPFRVEHDLPPQQPWSRH